MRSEAELLQMVEECIDKSTRDQVEQLLEEYSVSRNLGIELGTKITELQDALDSYKKNSGQRMIDLVDEINSLKGQRRQLYQKLEESTDILRQIAFNEDLGVDERIELARGYFQTRRIDDGEET